MRIEFDDSYRDVPISGAYPYAAQFGFDPNSNVARLIDFVRAEHRVKYGCDCRLVPHDDGSWEPVPGRGGTYGYDYLWRYADQAEVDLRGPWRAGDLALFDTTETRTRRHNGPVRIVRRLRIPDEVDYEVGRMYRCLSPAGEFDVFEDELEPVNAPA